MPAHSSNTRERFDRWSSSYDSWRSRQFFERLHRRLIPCLEAEKADSILDVGCGTGSLAIQLAAINPAAVVRGVDFSAGMIMAAREKLQPGTDVAFEVAAAEDLPFADEAFDLIYSTLSFHHWQDRRAGISECRRVLRPGGRLVIVDITGDKWYCRMYRACGRWRHLTGHVSYPMAAEVTGVFEATGLVDIKQTGVWPAILMTQGTRNIQTGFKEVKYK